MSLLTEVSAFEEELLSLPFPSHPHGDMRSCRSTTPTSKAVVVVCAYNTSARAVETGSSLGLIGPPTLIRDACASARDLVSEKNKVDG